jgi:peptide chain release factor 2
MKARTHLQNAISKVHKLEGGMNDNIGLIELGEAEGDASVVKDAENALMEMAKQAAQLELESLLSGEADGNDCYLEVNAGAGGTEAQDWAEMVFRMYMRWAEQHDYKISLLEESRGETAGLKSATIEISGENAYGWLKTESGVHRLVRISPYDSNARRHTSFCSVAVMPAVDDDIKIDIQEKDLNIETMRAGGAGGQHVNKTESAVRITHVPTGIVVACQQERSQVQNRAKAFEMLRARLYELELRKREEASAEINATKTDIGFGHQIRSYVLHPYQLVKDVRTGVETSNTQGVLDGELDPFLQASLAHRLKGTAETVEDGKKSEAKNRK